MACPICIAALHALMPMLLGAGDPSTKSGKKANPPAVVSNVIKESDLTTIKLQPKAEARLGIKTATIKVEEVRQTRMYGGQAIVPEGRSITVAAPLTGTVAPVTPHTFPRPGAYVAKGKPMLRLLPVVATEKEVLTPSERISLARARADLEAARVQAKGEQEAAKVQLEAAKIKVDRTKRLRLDNVGSVKAVDEARAEYELAEARLKAAQAKTEVLKSTIIDLGSGNLATLTMSSPVDGVIKSVQVSANQSVAAGTPMFQVIGVDPLWIRVPVYVGDLKKIDEKKPVRVRGLADPVGSPARVAKPVTAPPSGNPAASTIDLFFEVDNHDGVFRPDQRLIAIVPLGNTEKRKTVPWSAILYDVHGGTWVYENVEPHVFVRRRVELIRVVEQKAILARGPETGAKIVTAGAAELFGTEFGVGK